MSSGRPTRLAAVLGLAIGLDLAGAMPTHAGPPDSGQLTYPDRGHPQVIDVMPDSGTLIATSFDSAAMGQSRSILVRLPRSFGMIESFNRRYPTIYLLHGDFSDPGAWERLGAGAMTDALSAQGALPEVILVYPNGNGAARLPEWEDNPFTSDKLESQVLETVAFVDANFPTIPDRRFRAIGGLSSGAFGAANLASRHPDVFSIAMSFSGYFTSNGWVFHYVSSYTQANSPSATVRLSPAARNIHYVVTCGWADPLIFQARNFAAELRLVGGRVDASYFPGGHTFANWMAGLGFALQVVGPELRPPALPAPSPPSPPSRELTGRQL